MTDEELKGRLDSIKRRLSRLEQSRPGIVSGGDAEYFDQAGQLEKLDLRLKALIQFLEKSHHGITQQVDKDSKEAENAEAGGENSEITSAMFPEEDEDL
jgi:hypothetical protein